LLFVAAVAQTPKTTVRLGLEVTGATGTGTISFSKDSTARDNNNRLEFSVKQESVRGNLQCATFLY
jgi:hypothetical protein